MFCLFCIFKYVGYAVLGVGQGLLWGLSQVPKTLPYLDNAYKFVFCNTCGF